MEIFVYVLLEFAWKLHFFFLAWALLFLCLYMRGGAVYYHFCNLTTTKNLTLACRCDTYFPAKFLPKCVCPPPRNSTLHYMMKFLYFHRKLEPCYFRHELKFY